MKRESKKLPLTHALYWIIGSSLMISGSAYSGLKYYLRHERDKITSPSYWVRAIIQTGPQALALKTDYFAELLDISCDRPQSLFQFDVDVAKEKLIHAPVIKDIELKILPPYTVYIDYSARQPLAWLLDYENTAIDAEGHFFPVYPFFTPKNLPEIYLGLTFPFEKETKWHIPLNDKYLNLAFHVLRLIEETQYQEVIHLKRIDVSNAFSESYGNREIVLICEDTLDEAIHTRFLRLSTKNYPQELGNFLKLREQLVEKERNQPSSHKVIDLRLSNLGYIEHLP